MAFKNPFLAPESLAQEMMNDAQRTPSALATAAMLTPMALGGAYGYKALRSNEGGFINSFKTNSMKDMGISVGESLRGMQRAKQEVMDESAERLRKELMGGELLQKMQQSPARVKVELMAISELLADPASGIDESLSSNLRQRLSEAILNLDEGNIESTLMTHLEGVVDTLKTSGTQFELFEKYHRKAMRAKQHLSAPVGNLARNQPFFPLESGVFEELGDRRNSVEALKDNVEKMFGRKVDLVGTREALAGDQLSVYARIDRGRGKTPITLPLSYARVGGVAPIARAGSLATAYSTSRSFGYAKGLENALSTGAMSNALMSPEEFFLQELNKRVRTAGGIEHLDSRSFNDFMRTFFERTDRVAQKHSASKEMIAQNLLTRSSFVHIVGLEESKNPQALRARLAAYQDPRSKRAIFEGGADAEARAIPGSGVRYTKLGLNTESTIIANQRIPIFGMMSAAERRVLTPVVARIEQLYDRGGMAFVDAAGETASNLIKERRVNPGPLELDGLGQGAINRVTLFDFSKQGAMRTGLSEGELYMTGTNYVRQAIQPTILDPKAMTEAGKPMMSRQLYEEIIRRGGEIDIRGEKEIAEFFNKYGTVLGTSGASDVRVKPASGMTRLFLSAADVTEEAGGQAKVYFGGFTETAYGRNALRAGKVYGQAGKGMAKYVELNAITDFLSRVFMKNATLSDLGFGSGVANKSTLALATADTIFKAPTFLASQMVTGMGLAMGQTEEAVARGVSGLYESVGVAKGDVFRAGSTDKQIQRNFLLKLSENIADRMMREKGAGMAISGRAIGGVFAGVYQAAVQGKMGLGEVDVKSLGALIERTGGREALEAAERGVGVGLQSFMAGPQSNIYGANLASMEPRMFQQISYQLTNFLGFSKNQAQDFMAGMMARKLNPVGEINALAEITKTQASLVGARLDVATGKNVVGVQEFVEARRTAGGIKGLIRSNREGFILDLASSEQYDPVAGQRLERFAKEAFGGSTRIEFAGSDILDAVKGTTIKTAVGEDIEIGGQYERKLTQFSEDIERVLASVNKSDTEVKAAQRQFAGFRESFAEVYAGAKKRILSGKMRGSGWGTLLGYNLDKGGMETGASGSLELTERMKSVGRQIAKSTGGQYAFADYQAFVDSMKEFVGGAQDEFMGQGMSGPKARSEAMKEAGNRAMRFFLGMEVGDAANPNLQGNISMIGRHPMLGLTHNAFVDVYRAPEEIASLRGGGVVDEAMEAIRSTEMGRKALAKYAKTAGIDVKPEDMTFRQMRETSYDATGRLKKGKAGQAARVFFAKMGNNMDQFFGNVGGGRIFVGNREAEIHYTNVAGKSRTISMSIASGMGGDFDGDMAHLYNPAGAGRKGLIASMAKDEAIQKLDEYRARRSIFYEQAKGGLKELAEGSLPLTNVEAMLMEGVKKEEIAKNVGPVDLSLDRIRFGIMQAEGTSASKEKLLALADALEEATTIKGKKLERATDLSTMLTRSIGLAAEGDYTAFQNLLENVVFKGQAVMAEGASASIAGMDAPLDVSLSQSSIKTTMMDALEHSRKLGVDGAKTIRQTMGIAMGRTPEARRQFEALTVGMGAVEHAMAGGDDLATAIGGVINRGGNNMGSVASKLNRRLLGPLALGVAGSLGMGMLIGGEGHSGSAMVMPGEVIDPKIRSQIAGGTIFRQNQAPPVESLEQPPNGYADVGSRPIHSGNMYTSRSNAYSMRGEISSLSGINMISNYMNMARATGTVTINDTRRPITPNYLDRMMDY